MSDDKYERIRRRAYELWESEERPHGEDIRHWIQAQDEFDDKEATGETSVDSTDTGITPQVEITTGERSPEEAIRETEGP